MPNTIILTADANISERNIQMCGVISVRWRAAGVTVRGLLETKPQLRLKLEMWKYST